MRYHNWWKNPDTDRWFNSFFNHLLEPFDDNTKNTFLQKIDMVSVFGRPEIVHSIPKTNIKILFIGENTSRQGYERYSNHTELAKNYDLVLGFNEQPLNLRNIKRFPLWLTYIDYYKDLNVLAEHKKLCNNSHTRDKKGIIVCSHDRTGIRKKCVDECLSKGMRVSIAGKWSYNVFNDNGEVLTNKVVIGDRNIHKIQLLRAYFINICPENSIAPDYVTEKVFQSIQAGCLPLYSGNDPVEPEVLNQDRVVYFDNLKELSVDQLIEKSKLNPYTDQASFWIMKNYLEVWSKIWYISHSSGLRFKYAPRTPHTLHTSSEGVHNYFIIPYRNRVQHIQLWTKFANEIYSNSLKFDVILVEQYNDNPFNKGILLNVGFWKAMEIHHKRYGKLMSPRPNLIFNDVDVFCKEPKFIRPEEYIYHPYGDDHCLGCIFVCSPEAYLSFNGFSNKYNGWGREDVDALERAKIQKIIVKTDGYQRRRSNRSFIEFNHPSNITKIEENYAEYDALLKDNSKLYDSGVTDKFIVEKSLASKSTVKILNNIKLLHVFVE